ncbi:unnamed protein product, partial [Mesorhabditis spiculigera]
MLLLAIFNIVYATAHLLVIPVTYIHGFGFCFYSSSFMAGYKYIGYGSLLGYCSLFAQSTILLAYHFIYRYACICKPNWLALIHTKRVIGLLSVAYLSYFGLWVTLLDWFLVIFVCGWKMNEKLRSAEMCSARGYRLQKQLFQALMIQFIVPIILEYIPCTSIFLVPMLGEEINLEWATMCISLYPIFEPLAVIYFVKVGAA